MYVSSFLDRPVVTQDTKQKVGHIVEVLFNAQYREVLGFRVQQGRNASSKSAEVFMWSAIHAIAKEQVTILSFNELRSEARYVPLAQALTFQQVRATKVVSQEGGLLGTIQDVELDEHAHLVRAFLIAPAAKNRRAHAEALVTIDHVVQSGTTDKIVLDKLGGAQVLQLADHP